MDTSVLKRHRPNQSLGMVLALGLLASVALAAATFDWPNDDPAVLPGADARIALQAQEQRYFDAKVARTERMELGAQYGSSITADYVEPTAGQLAVLNQADLNAAEAESRSHKGKLRQGFTSH